jgi:hypothetical protein
MYVSHRAGELAKAWDLTSSEVQPGMQLGALDLSMAYAAVGVRREHTILAVLVRCGGH